jgi:hypothetical protein
MTPLSKNQTARLHQQGIAVMPGTLQGLPVLLLAQVPGAGAVRMAAPLPVTAPMPTGQRQQARPQRPACHLKRPPHRPMRS